MPFPRPQEILQTSPVIPVVVIEDPSQAVPLAKTLLEGGLGIIEVTLRSEAALEGIRAIAREVPEILLGAGTVLDPEQLKAVFEAGASFAISPGITPNLLQAASKKAYPLVPGLATVSELMLGLDHGFRVFKFFPAEAAGGIAYLKALAGPFPQVVFCPTGGINQENFLSYLSLSNVACVGGSWMVPKDLLRQGDWAGIKNLVEETLRLVDKR